MFLVSQLKLKNWVKQVILRLHASDKVKWDNVPEHADVHFSLLKYYDDEIVFIRLITKCTCKRMMNDFNKMRKWTGSFFILHEAIKLYLRASNDNNRQAWLE